MDVGARSLLIPYNNSNNTIIAANFSIIERVNKNPPVALCYCSACCGKERHPMSARYDLILE